MRVTSFIKMVLFTVGLNLSVVAAFSTTDISVLSPKSGASAGSPVFFEASATTTCANGVSAMRIYTAPHVSAYTANSAHLETFIKLAPGTYNTVVQAWDNCGGVAKVPVSVTVNSTAQVSVFLPSGYNVSSPQHFAASAQNPTCPAGIAAMRIYTSDGFTPYTVDSNVLNAYIVLKAATYNATVQAYDKCGNVIKANFQIRSSGSDEDSYVYTNSVAGTISQFDVSLEGDLLNPNGSGNPPQYPSASSGNSIVVDPGGWFTYTASTNGIFGYQINHPNGALIPVQGSPFALSHATLVFADPAGNFVYAIYNLNKSIASYRIDRSTGALTLSSSITPGVTITALSTDPYGKFLYAGTNAGQVYGYVASPDSGALSPAPGSPFTIPGATDVFALTAAYTYLYAGVNTSSGAQIDGYAISYNSGYLSPVPGNPYSAPGTLAGTQSVLADWLARYVWTANPQGDGSSSFWEFPLYGLYGNLGPANFIDATGYNVSYLAESYDASVVYSTGTQCGTMFCAGTADSWAIDGSGLLKHLSGPLSTGTTIPTGIAVERQDPQ